MSSYGREAGVTLLELMVAMTIMAILLTIAMPSFSTYLANTQLRAVADNLHAGLQGARMEAIKGNRNTAFLVFDSDNNWVTYDTSATIVTGNVCGSTSTPASNQIQRSCSENKGATLNPDPTATVVKVSFDSQGRASTGSWTTNGCTNNSSGNSVPSGYSAGLLITVPSATNQLCILVGAGGQTRLCDPNNNTLHDPRNCSN